VLLPPGSDATKEAIDAAGIVCGTGWTAHRPALGGVVRECAERVDDYCATAYAYLRDVQGVAPVDVAAATADVGRLPYERGSGFVAGIA
jgi:hypothetical protein